MPPPLPESVHASGGPTEQLSLFAREAAQPVHIAQPEPTIKVSVVDTPKKLDDLVKALASAKVISFDTETTSTEEMQANIVGISLAIQEGEGYYIPVGHLAGHNLPLEQVISALARPIHRSPHSQGRPQRQVRFHHPRPQRLAPSPRSPSTP